MLNRKIDEVGFLSENVKCFSNLIVHLKNYTYFRSFVTNTFFFFKFLTSTFGYMTFDIINIWSLILCLSDKKLQPHLMVSAPNFNDTANT
jgi:hypothetical protein